MPPSSPLPLGASGQEEAGSVKWRVFLPMGLSMHPRPCCLSGGSGLQKPEHLCGVPKGQELSAPGDWTAGFLRAETTLDS